MGIHASLAKMAEALGEGRARTWRLTHPQPGSSHLPLLPFQARASSLVTSRRSCRRSSLHAARVLEATRVEERDGRDDDGINQGALRAGAGRRGLVKLVVNKAQLEEKITALQSALRVRGGRRRGARRAFVQPVAERAAAEVEYKYHPSVREAKIARPRRLLS